MRVLLEQLWPSKSHPGEESPEVNPLRTSGTVPEYDFCRAGEGH